MGFPLAQYHALADQTEEIASQLSLMSAAVSATEKAAHAAANNSAVASETPAAAHCSASEECCSRREELLAPLRAALSAQSEHTQNLLRVLADAVMGGAAATSPPDGRLQQLASSIHRILPWVLLWRRGWSADEPPAAGSAAAKKQWEEEEEETAGAKSSTSQVRVGPPAAERTGGGGGVATVRLLGRGRGEEEQSTISKEVRRPRMMMGSGGSSSSSVMAAATGSDGPLVRSKDEPVGGNDNGCDEGEEDGNELFSSHGADPVLSGLDTALAAAEAAARDFEATYAGMITVHRLGGHAGQGGRARPVRRDAAAARAVLLLAAGGARCERRCGDCAGTVAARRPGGAEE